MLRDKSRFFGRKAELAALWGYLEKQSDVSLVAERRMGKSSLLWYLKETAPRQPQFEYLDMEAVSSADEFFSRLAEMLKADGETARDLERALSKRSLVLSLDELDHAVNNPAFPDDFFHILRALSQAPGLTLVVATKARLADLRDWGNIVSPFPNIFPTVPLGLMPDDEARELLVNTAALAEITFDDETLAKAIKLGEGRPWRLQLMGWHLVEAEKDWKEAERRFRESLAESGGNVSSQTRRQRAPAIQPRVAGASDWLGIAGGCLTLLASGLIFFSMAAREALGVIVGAALALVALALFVYRRFFSA